LDNIEKVESIPFVPSLNEIKSLLIIEPENGIQKLDLSKIESKEDSD